MKKPRRRRLQGRPLLIAGTGMSAVIIGCSGGPDPEPEVYVSGNLVAPPMLELCVEVSPEEASEEATVTTNSQPLPSTEPRCASVYEGTVTLEASAPGFEDYSEELVLTGDTTHTIEMVPEETE